MSSLNELVATMRDRRGAVDTEIGELRGRLAELEEERAALTRMIDAALPGKAHEPARVATEPTGRAPRTRRPGRRKGQLLVSERRLRDTVRRLGTFNSGEIAAELGMSRQGARNRVARLVDKGIVRVVKERPAQWEYVKPTDPGPVTPPRPEPDLPTVDVPQRRGIPVAGTGRTSGPTSSREINDLLATVRDQIKTRRGREHLRVICKATKAEISVSTTSSDVNAVHQVRRDLERIGVRIEQEARAA